MYGVHDTSIYLEEYWQFLQIEECAGYGIQNFPDESLTFGCNAFWDQIERYYVSVALSQAERRMRADRWLGFPVRRFQEKPRQIDFEEPLYLGKYVRQVGVETEEAVSTETVTHRTGGVIDDPITLSITVDFTDKDELIIRYPESYWLNRKGEGYRIIPSYVSISGTVATVEIPRCRLLRPEFFLNYTLGGRDNERPQYETDANFLDTVEIFRNYVDTTTGANFVWWRVYANQLCIPSSLFQWNEPSAVCPDVSQSVCTYIRNQRDGLVQMEAATYNSTTSAYERQSLAVRRVPNRILVNYMRGFYDRYDEIDDDLMRAIVAIAHNNLPKEYKCKCALQQQYLDEDRRALEPPVNMGLGPSTWGIFAASQIIREFDMDRNSHFGGLL